MQPTDQNRRDVLIVGAGPAGMAAAITLALAGLSPMVLDENQDVGGQIFRRPPVPLRDVAGSVSTPSRAELDLRREFDKLRGRIELCVNAKVWGIFPEKRVAVLANGSTRMIDARHVVLATGAYEYVPPFPGWTLPGVMTAGGAQQLVKAMHVLPGKRALVVGTGPFLLVVAGHLHDAGVEVAGIVDPVRRIEMTRVAGALLAQWGLLREAVALVRKVQRAGIPRYRGSVILEAKGDEQVAEVLIAPCDKVWYPDRARARSIAVDTVCVGYGFVPRIQLAQLAGCRMEFVDPLGGWVPQVNEHLETTVPGLWVAGDGAGVAGAVVAQLEGRLVGLEVACRLGAITPPQLDARRRPLASRLKRLRRFRAALDRVSRIRPGLSSLTTPETLVCRCEELSRREIDAGIAAGGASFRSLKVMTRLGMGLCQGRMCWPAMGRYLALQTGKSVAEIGPLSVRPPIKPVCVADLAAP
jgi:NADPH-dependent 2,4-dienoyl-CoA reductase/sulfur reductase-like enzyme